MQDAFRIFGNGKSSKTTNKNKHHKSPSGLGYPKPEGRDEGESYTLFRTLPWFEFALALCVLVSTMVLIAMVDTNVEVPTFRAKLGDFFL